MSSLMQRICHRCLANLLCSYQRCWCNTVNCCCFTWSRYQIYDKDLQVAWVDSPCWGWSLLYFGFLSHSSASYYNEIFSPPVNCMAVYLFLNYCFVELFVFIINIYALRRSVVYAAHILVFEFLFQLFDVFLSKFIRASSVSTYPMLSWREFFLLRLS